MRKKTCLRDLADYPANLAMAVLNCEITAKEAEVEYLKKKVAEFDMDNVMGSVALLKERDRNIFFLYFHDRMEIAEIANRYRLSRRRIYALMRDVLRFLLRCHVRYWETGETVKNIPYVNSSLYYSSNPDTLDANPVYINSLGLPVHIVTALHRANIFTISELEEKTAADILAIRNIGDIALSQIQGSLSAIGRHLKDE